MTPQRASEVLIDREADPSRRMRAIEMLGEHPEASSSMTRIVWSDREPTELRVACMDRLIAQDDEAFWLIGRRHLPTVNRPAMLKEVCQRAGENGRPELTGSLVRSWARPSKTMTDAQRPEATALRTIHDIPDGETITPLLWSMLDDSANAPALNEQLAAWVILNRLIGNETAKHAIQKRSTGRTPGRLAAALLRADILTPLPSKRETVLWLLYLDAQDDARDVGWAAANRVADAGHAVSLRHLAVLQTLDDLQPLPGREDLKRTIRTRLNGQPTHPRGLDREDEVYVAPIEERFSAAAPKLPFGDLLTIVVILETLDRPEVRASIFTQADDDLADTTSEHGGVILSHKDTFIAQRFASKLKADDRTFISSHQLIEAAYTGLAHYHFHAQQHDNAPYAGPGPGDFGFSKRLGMNCLVFTFIEPNTLAVDYYQPDGIAVDLGVIRRPGT